MLSLSFPSPSIPERTQWIFIGAFAVLSLLHTYHRLSTFRSLCEVPPTLTRDPVKPTEDSISLNTLSVLSRGINHDLRLASLRIISDRAIRDPTVLPFILSQVSHTDPAIRRKGLTILRYLSISAFEMPHPRVFELPSYKALIQALHYSLNPETADLPTDQITYRVLHRFVLHNRQKTLDAGIAEFLKRKPELVLAYFEPQKYEHITVDKSLVKIFDILIFDCPAAKELFRKEGLLPEDGHLSNAYGKSLWHETYQYYREDVLDDIPISRLLT